MRALGSASASLAACPWLGGTVCDKPLAGRRAPVKGDFVLLFQKVVQEELDALLEQQSTIENKMVALQRMGLVTPTHPLPFFPLLHAEPPCRTSLLPA